MVQQLQPRFTFLTPLIVPSVNEQVARTFWEAGQDEKLQERWDTCGGEQDGPVLFFTQQLSVEPHRDVWSKSRQRQVQTRQHRSWGKVNILLKISVYLRPTTCPTKIPTVMKTEVPIPMAPRSAVGAISPKYRGWTQMPMPMKTKHD